MKMYSVVILLILSICSGISFGEEVNDSPKLSKKQTIVEVNYRDYNIRIGQELIGAGWIMRNGNVFCTYRDGLNKHYINQNIFKERKCPKKLIGAKKPIAKPAKE